MHSCPQYQHKQCHVSQAGSTFVHSRHMGKNELLWYRHCLVWSCEKQGSVPEPPEPPENELRALFYTPGICSTTPAPTRAGQCPGRFPHGLQSPPCTHGHKASGTQEKCPEEDKHSPPLSLSASATLLPPIPLSHCLNLLHSQDPDSVQLHAAHTNEHD